MGYALYAQYVLNLSPCPLCIFQRIALTALGLVFVGSALHAPRGAAARVYAGLGFVTAAAGLGIALWHVHVTHLPPDLVPSCGPGLGYIWETFPFAEMLKMVFTGSGECAKIDWVFAGLSMPAWVAIWFVVLGTLAIAANFARLTR